MVVGTEEATMNDIWPTKNLTFRYIIKHLGNCENGVQRQMDTKGTRVDQISKTTTGRGHLQTCPLTALTGLAHQTSGCVHSPCL